MKKTLKRLIALILVLSMCLSLFGANAWAEKEDTPEAEPEVVNENIDIEGENSVGSLISDELKQQGEEQAASQWGVTGLEVSDATATVDYYSGSSAKLVAAVYDEETEQMCAVGSVVVKAGKATQKVKMTGNMPKYFIAKAFLVDLDTEAPLCESYSTAMNTKVMRQLNASTVNDYDEERVVNLDDNIKTNFLVYDDQVSVLNPEGGQNTISQENGVYTITNAGEDALALKPGDIFAVTDSEGNELIVKVGKVDVDGDTVTITEDPNISLEEVFETIKIDSTQYQAEKNSHSAGELTTQAIDFNHTASAKISLEKELEAKGDVASASGTIGGSLTVSVEFKLYLSADYKEFLLKFQNEFEVELDIKGKFTGAIPLGEDVGIQPVPGVYITLTPSVLLEVSGKLHPHLKFSSATGIAYDSRSKWHSVNEPMHLDEADVDVEGTIFVGVSLEPKVKVVDDVFSAKITAEIGTEFKLSDSLANEIKRRQIEQGESIHDCTACFDGTAKTKVEFSGSLHAIILGAELKPLKETKELGKCYISRCDGKWDAGFGACPHCRYKVYVMATAKADGKPVKDCTMTFSNKSSSKSWKEQPKTDEKGLALIYLPAGEYEVEGRYGNIVGSADLTVYEMFSNTSMELDTGRLVTISAKRPDGTPAVGAEITGAHIPKGIKTDSTGTASFYSAQGQRTVSVYDYESDSEGSKEFKVGAKDLKLSVPLTNRVYNVQVFVRDTTGAGIETKVTCGDQTGWSFFGTIYALLHLPNGKHTIHVENPAGEDVEQEVTVNRGDVTVKVELPEVKYPVSVIVLNKDGTPASGAAIQGTGLSSNPVTDSDGKAEFEMPGGKHTLNVEYNDQYANKTVQVNGKTDVVLNLAEAWMDWDYNKDTGVLRIWGAGPMKGNPWWHSEKGSVKSVVISGLTSICGQAFDDYKHITSVTIPDSVTSIEHYAFSGCTSLTSVTIPAGVTSIIYNAFSGCTSLRSVTIPGSVTSIGSGAFSNCTGLTSVTMVDGVTSIGGGMFYGCTSLRSVTIPESVTSIGGNAFSGCSSLTSVEIPNSVTSIGDFAFKNCSSLTSVEIPDSVTSIGCNVFYDCSSLTSITIPDSVTSIGGSAFSGCTSLKSVTIPDSVTNIGGSAFSGCTSLKSVTIPDSVTNIGESAFSECTGLINVTIPNSVTTVGKYAFSGCTDLTSIRILSSVATIKDNAFSGCTGLTSITIPGSITQCGKEAFKNCSALEDVIILDGSAVINDGFRMPFSQMKRVSIPNSVITIEKEAFKDCTRLTSVTIPDSVTSIGIEAFSGCTGLTSVTIPGNIPQCGSGAFKNCSALEEVDFLDGSTGINGRLSIQFSQVKRVVIPDSVISIERNAFTDCAGLTSVTIPDSVTSIGDFAFSRCTGLTSVKVSDGVTGIGYGTFQGCTGLTSITIPDRVTSIGKSAFSDCTGLTSVTIPDTVTNIGNYAFSGCAGLTSVTIPERVTSIGHAAFSDCTCLTNISIPINVTVIQGGTFLNCSSLSDVYYRGTEQQWNNISIYSSNDPLKSATIHYNSNGPTEES